MGQLHDLERTVGKDGVVDLLGHLVGHAPILLPGTLQIGKLTFVDQAPFQFHLTQPLIVDIVTEIDLSSKRAVDGDVGNGVGMVDSYLGGSAFVRSGKSPTFHCCERERFDGHVDVEVALGALKGYAGMFSSEFSSRFGS